MVLCFLLLAYFATVECDEYQGHDPDRTPNPVLSEFEVTGTLPSNIHRKLIFQPRFSPSDPGRHQNIPELASQLDAGEDP